MNFEWKPFLMVLLVAVLLFAVFGLSIYGDWGLVVKPPQDISATNFDAYNEAALHPGTSGVFEIDLFFTVSPPSSNQEERMLEIFPTSGIEVYAHNDNPEQEVSEVCVDWVDMVVEVDLSYRFHSFLQEPMCHTITEKDYLQDGDFYGPNDTTFTVTNFYQIGFDMQDSQRYRETYSGLIGKNFWFPYDNFAVSVYIQAQATAYYKNGESATAVVPPYFEWRLLTSGSRAWDIDLTNTLSNLSENDQEFFYGGFIVPGPYQKVDFVFNRPLLFRISFPLLIIAMSVFIGLVPMMKNSSTDSILGVMAGLLFATFALRSILSPGDEMGQGLVDLGIIGLNILQVFSAVYLFTRILRDRREKAKASDEANVQ